MEEPPGTFSREGTGLNLAVVPPAGPHRAAALFLGGVPRQDVAAEFGVAQVVVALLSLLFGRAGGRGVSRQGQAHVICVCVGGGGARRAERCETLLWSILASSLASFLTKLLEIRCGFTSRFVTSSIMCAGE